MMMNNDDDDGDDDVDADAVSEHRSMVVPQYVLST